MHMLFERVSAQKHDVHISQQQGSCGFCHLNTYERAVGSALSTNDASARQIEAFAASGRVGQGRLIWMCVQLASGFCGIIYG